MVPRADAGGGVTWRRHFVYRKESLVTTWKFRLAIVLCGVLFVTLTRMFWVPGLGRSLVCNGQIGKADAILVENLEPNYLSFERAAALRKSGVAARVLVPTRTSSDPEMPDAVAAGVVRVMAGAAWLGDFEIVPIKRLDEPITLTVAHQVREYAAKRNIRSMILVTPAFRSRRSALIYEAVLGPSGTSVGCEPVFGETTSDTWMESWHGVLEVGEQYLKLLYYRLCVMPFLPEK